MRPLYIVHTDVCGPITPSTVNDENYYVIFIDQYTHYCVTYLIKQKSHVFEMFKDFVNRSEAQFNLKLVYLYCDNGREYLSQAMKDFCVEKGISYHLTVPYTPQLNGVAERMIRTITEKARTMLYAAGLEESFWGEAVLTATFLINRSPSNAISKHEKTPYELWHGRKPLLKYLRIFGSIVYRLNKLRSAKFEGKSLKGILVGYETNGYKVWCLEENKFVKARDVVVNEGCFIQSRSGEDYGKGSDQISDYSVEKNLPGNNLKNPCTINENCKAKAGMHDSQLKKARLEGTEDERSTDEANDDSSAERQIDERQRRSDRIRNQEKKSYDDNNVWYDNCVMHAQGEIDDVPISYNELKYRSDKSCWLKAIEDELESHKINRTWSLVEKPVGKNIVDSKWHFTVKVDEYGNPIRHKARLVVRGFTQEHMVDYTETFAPVARIASFRFMVAFANQNNLYLHHMDVKTAFLNGDLKDEIFMKPPEHVMCDLNMVCKLNKSIYGLKQAARCWYQKLDAVLRQKGFKNSEVDKCVYVLDKDSLSENIYIVLYVDDLVIMTAFQSSLKEVKSY